MSWRYLYLKIEHNIRFWRKILPYWKFLTLFPFISSCWHTLFTSGPWQHGFPLLSPALPLQYSLCEGLSSERLWRPAFIGHGHDTTVSLSVRQIFSLYLVVDGSGYCRTLDPSFPARSGSGCDIGTLCDVEDTQWYFHFLWSKNPWLWDHSTVKEDSRDSICKCFKIDVKFHAVIHYSLHVSEHLYSIWFRLLGSCVSETHLIIG